MLPELHLADWRPTKVEGLQETDLQALFAQKPQLVLLGTGDRQQFPHVSIRGAFARAGEQRTADDLLAGKASVKYSPVEVAAWLDSLAAKTVVQGTVPRRWAEDIAIQAGIGRFFAAKFRSGVLWAIHEKTGDRAALEEALKQYRGARAAWATFAERAKAVYLPDIPFGSTL